MIVFVGSNPSVASGSNRPFDDDTKSYKTLWSWINASGIVDVVHYYNVSNQTTENNRPLNAQEIRDCVPELQKSLQGFTKIVALGKTAHRALEMAGIDHLAIDHPSGMNRKLNCNYYVNALISKLRDYAYPG